METMIVVTHQMKLIVQVLKTNIIDFVRKWQKSTKMINITSHSFTTEKTKQLPKKEVFYLAFLEKLMTKFEGFYH